MIAYSYDEKGYFNGSQNCQIDPLESAQAGKEIYLLPAKCTFKKPLEEKEGFKIKWTGKKWVYEEIIEPAVEEKEPTEEEKKKIRIYELKSLLASSDYKALKYAEGWISEEEYKETKEQRQQWRDEINEIESSL